MSFATNEKWLLDSHFRALECELDVSLGRMRVFFLMAVPVALLAQTTNTATSSATKPRPAATGHPAAKPAAARAVKPQRPALTTDDQKTIYAAGLFIYDRSIQQLNLSPAELDIVKQAITDAAAGKPALDLNTWGPKLQAFAYQRQQQLAARSHEEATVYLAKAAAEPGAVKTGSGLIYREITAGSGPSPNATDTVRVHYRGTLPDGKEFDSSYARSEPAEFPLNRVIKCWTEGLQKMKVGGKSILVCPSDLAYGEQGHPPTIPPGAALTFQVELLGIVNPPAPGAK